MSRREDLVIPSIVLDRSAPSAIYRQLAAQLADAIHHGTLDGVRLPSTRVPNDGRAVAAPFAPLRVLRDAQYPARTLEILDPDGASLYLTY